MSINKVKPEDKRKVIDFYLKKSLPEKKGFFPGRMGFKWVKINKEKAMNDLGNLTEFGKEKLLEQNIKAELAYQGYDSPLNEPSKEEVKEILQSIRKDMISKGAW